MKLLESADKYRSFQMNKAADIVVDRIRNRRLITVVADSFEEKQSSEWPVSGLAISVVTVLGSILLAVFYKQR